MLNIFTDKQRLHKSHHYLSVVPQQARAANVAGKVQPRSTFRIYIGFGRYEDGDVELLNLAEEAVRAAEDPSRTLTELPGREFVPGQVVTPSAGRSGGTGTSKLYGRFSSNPGLEGLGPEEIVIGRRVLVYWPTEKTWYAGQIGRYDAQSRLHWIEYDDGDRYRADVFTKRVRFERENQAGSEEDAGFKSPTMQGDGIAISAPQAQAHQGRSVCDDDEAVRTGVRELPVCGEGHIPSTSAGPACCGMVSAAGDSASPRPMHNQVL